MRDRESTAQVLPVKGSFFVKRALHGVTRRPIVVSLLFMIFLYFAFLPSAGADVHKERMGDKEAVLHQARQLMDKEETNRVNMKKAASLLERYAPKFPDEFRIPLYLAEAYYRMVDPAEDIQKGYPYFEKAGVYAQKALRMEPGRMESHYWHGLFLLRKAQKVSIFQAYFVAREGVRELELVRESMPAYDHGGASRVLGLLYYKAPGWSPFGDVNKAVRYEEEATRIEPHYLLNRLYLAEAYQKQGDNAAAIREYRIILASSSSLPGGKGGNPFREMARSRLLALS